MIPAFSFSGKRILSDKQITTNTFSKKQLHLTAGDVLHIEKTVDHEATSIHLNKKPVIKSVGYSCGIATSYLIPRPGPAVISFKNYDLPQLQTSTLLPGGQLFILTEF
jgi:hypothetical protein